MGEEGLAFFAGSSPSKEQVFGLHFLELGPVISSVRLLVRIQIPAAGSLIERIGFTFPGSPPRCWSDMNALPATAARTDVRRIPIFAMSSSSPYPKASVAIKSDIVNPIPQSRLAAKTCHHELCAGRIAILALFENHPNRKIPISNNVGTVKRILSNTSACTPRRAPFRSSGWFARFQPGLAWNRSGQELGPTQPSLRSLTAIKIRFFELPYFEGAGCPIITSVIDCTPSGCPGSPACLFGPAAR